MRISLGFWGLLGASIVACSVNTTVNDPIILPGSTTPASPVLGGAALEAQTPPPPLAGATVRIVKVASAGYAVVSDPDEDSVHIVSLANSSPVLVGTIPLQRGDEPNRIVGDASGHAWVVLRGGGSVAMIDVANAKLLARPSVCPAPRGVDYNASTDTVWVACATGELVTLTSGGQVTRTVHVDRDLRDVMVSGGQVRVTRFRSAELLTLDQTGAILSRSAPGAPSTSVTNGSNMQPNVAWRTIANVKTGVTMLHQLATTDALVVVPANTYYAETNGDISISATTSNGGQAQPVGIEQAIDMTTDASGTIEILSLTGAVQVGGGQSPSGTVYLGSNPSLGVPDTTAPTPEFTGIDDGNAIGVPFVVVQQRQPTGSLLVFAKSLPTQATNTLQTVQPTFTVPFSTTSHVDSGWDIFHLPTRVGTACMNCHPEGADDGHAWKFNFNDQNGTLLEVRLRRTQSLLGGEVTVSAPYHWDGDLPDLQSLMDEVFTHRMGGGLITPQQETILARWLNALPQPAKRDDLDPAAVSRGQAIFGGAAACTTCHAGADRAVTGNQDVGKTDLLGSSKPLKVPMLLGVGNRAPYMHDGCAQTLMDRLTNPACAGTKHGNTAGLAQSDLNDLETYLESL